MPLVIPWWDRKLFILRLSSDTNVRVIFWFLNLYNFHVASSSTITPRMIEFRYGKRIYIYNNLQFLHCVTSNNHTLCDLLNWPKPIVSVSIYICILLYWAVVISILTSLSHRINSSLVSLFPQFFFCSLIYESILHWLFTSFSACKFNRIDNFTCSLLS